MKKKILLIDADSKIPNLALMKLSMFHKTQGDSVNLVRANLPYYPNKKREYYHVDTAGYDKVYCSTIFDVNKDYVVGDGIEFGGTGVSLEKRLPEEVESIQPDYSIYPESNRSYGFITRGCIRNCYFCKVPKKEGGIVQVANPKDIVKHSTVDFLDNNILAHPEHKRILDEIIGLDVRARFSQGLDIRLLDEENSALIGRMRRWGGLVFAFDDINLLSVIEKKSRILPKTTAFKITFYAYVHPNMELSNIIKRVKWLREHEFLPYVMRDITCWDSEYNKFYIDLAGWCNQPHLFSRMDFDEYLVRKHPNDKERNKKHIEYYMSV